MIVETLHCHYGFTVPTRNPKIWSRRKIVVVIFRFYHTGFFYPPHHHHHQRVVSKNQGFFLAASSSRFGSDQTKLDETTQWFYISSRMLRPQNDTVFDCSGTVERESFTTSEKICKKIRYLKTDYKIDGMISRSDQTFFFIRSTYLFVVYMRRLRMHNKRRSQERDPKDRNAKH